MFGQFRDPNTGELLGYLGTKKLAQLLPESNRFDLKNRFLFEICGGHNCLICVGNNGQPKVPPDINEPMPGCTMCLGSRRVVHYIGLIEKYPKWRARYIYGCSSDVKNVKGDCDPTKDYQCFYEKMTLKSDKQAQDIGYKIPVTLKYSELSNSFELQMQNEIIKKNLDWLKQDKRFMSLEVAAYRNNQPICSKEKKEYVSYVDPKSLTKQNSSGRVIIRYKADISCREKMDKEKDSVEFKLRKSPDIELNWDKPGDGLMLDKLVISDSSVKYM
jgi:hypothetical protein